MLTPPRGAFGLVVGSLSVELASVMLRSASDSVPSCLRQRQRFGLARRQFERRGLADHDLLAVLLLDVLVDRQHADVVQDRFAGLHLGAGGFFGVAIAARQDDVDAVVRQDEAAGAGFRRNLRRDRAHAGRQDRRHEARALGVDQLGFADRLAGDERRARDRAGQRFDARPAGRSCG